MTCYHSHRGSRVTVPNSLLKHRKHAVTVYENENIAQIEEAEEEAEEEHEREKARKTQSIVSLRLLLFF